MITRIILIIVSVALGIVTDRLITRIIENTRKIKELNQKNSMIKEASNE